MALGCKIDLKTNRKILSLENLEVKIIGLRCAHPCQKIVLTTGVFDLVHPGHLDYFDKARSFGDVLIVSVVDDEFVDKGPGRPIFDQNLRLSWLAALEVIDYVVLNGDFGPWKVMKAIKPDVYVKGYNLSLGLIQDISLMRHLNGQTVLIPEIMHSTEIFEKIRQLADKQKTP